VTGREGGGQAHCGHLDVHRSRESVRRCYVATRGGATEALDVIVNAAGRPRRGRKGGLSELTRPRERLLEVDVIGADEDDTRRYWTPILDHARRARCDPKFLEPHTGHGVNHENAINAFPSTYSTCLGAKGAIRGFNQPPFARIGPGESAGTLFCPWDLSLANGRRVGQWSRRRTSERQSDEYS